MGLALFTGLCLSTCMMLQSASIRENGAPLTTTFNRLGVILPVVVSAAMYGEVPGALQIAGLLLAGFSIVYINSGKGESHIRRLSYLALVLVIGGCVDLASKLFGQCGQPDLQAYYVFWSFIFAAAVGLVFLLRSGARVRRGDVVAGVLIGIPNQVVTYVKLLAVAILPSYIVFPVFSAGTIFVVNIVNYLLYREKFTRRELVSMGMIGLSLILLNM